MKSLGNAEIFGANLRRYIEQSGKLDKDIAEIIGVSPATVSEWKKGKKYPRIEKIEMLARYFHIQKSDLIEEHKDDLSSIRLMPGDAEFLSAYHQMSPERKKFVLDWMHMMLNDNNNMRKD